MQRICAKMLSILIGCSAPIAAAAQNNVPEVFPQIIIEDTTKLWDETAQSWRFSARVSLYHPQTIAGGKGDLTERQTTDDDAVQPGDDGRVAPPAATPIRPPQVVSVTAHYARHLYPASGAHEVGAQIELIPPWPITGGQNTIKEPQPVPLPPVDLDKLREDEEVSDGGAPLPTPPTVVENPRDGRQLPKRGLYLKADAIAAPDVPGTAATRGDSLFWRWEVVWRDRVGEERTTLSPVQSQVVDCTPAATRRDLMRLQERALAYDQPALRITPTGGPLGIPGAIFNRNLVTDGIVVPPHLAATIAGNGFTLARTEATTGMTLPTDILVNSAVSLKPTLVFYQPDRLVGETRAAYIARISEREWLDPRYRMIGFAFAQPHAPQVSRPSLGCIPSENWFIHEAGWHLTDGGFRPTPPRERIRGERRVLARSQLPSAVIRQKGDLQWHGRIWDMHFWLDPACPDRSCPPIISIFAPFDVPGLPLTEPLFFKSEVFE